MLKVYQMAPCAYEYFRALHDPFSLATLPCIPTTFAQSSHKYRATTRGTFRVGTEGLGGVAFWPFRGAFSDIVVDGGATTSYPCIIATNQTYAQTDFSFTNNSRPNPIPGTDFYPGVTSPFRSTDFGDTARSVRLVAAGIRVQYIDKVLEMSGDYVTFRNPNATNSLETNADTLTKLLANNTATFNRVNENWVGVTYVPYLASDLDPIRRPGSEYQMQESNVVGNVGARFAGGVFIQNAQPGQRFAFEFIGFYEATGVALATSPSHTDPQSLAYITQSATNSVPTSDLAQSERIGESALVKTIKDVGYNAVRVGGTYLAAGARVYAENAAGAAAGAVGSAVLGAVRSAVLPHRPPPRIRR